MSPDARQGGATRCGRRLPVTSGPAALTCATAATRSIAALLLTVTLVAGDLPAATPAPITYGGPGCIDFWIVSTRSIPPGCPPDDAINHIAVWHREAAGWAPYSLSAFIVAIDSDTPVSIYVNGIFTSAESATRESQQLFANVGAGMPPFRGVLWLWPSDYEFGTGLREQVNRALVRSQAEALYLSTVIRSLRKTPAVNLLGHSFGCQIVAEALVRLAKCQIAWQVSAGGCPPQPRLQAALVAPTIDPCSLLPGRALHEALSPVDRLLVTSNPDDVALGVYEEIHQRRALGLRGLPVAPLGLPANVLQVDAGPAVGFRHAASIYFQSPAVAGWLRSFVSAG